MATLKQQMEQAAQAAARSNMLWRYVNSAIAGIIEQGIKNHKSRKQIAQRLRNLAGPKEKNEMSCLANYRSAAQSIENSTDLCLI